MGKINGFNDKEQRVFSKLKNGEPHDFRELKSLFWEEAKIHCKKVYEPGWGEHEIDAQAQSFARNSIRKLIRDGWVTQTGRGTYKLTKTGKARIEKGVSATPSVGRKSRKTKGIDKVTQTDLKKVKAIIAKVTKESQKDQIVAKAKKASAKADKENGHKGKLKQMAARAKSEQSIEEKLASAIS